MMQPDPRHPGCADLMLQAAQATDLRWGMHVRVGASENGSHRRPTGRLAVQALEDAAHLA